MARRTIKVIDVAEILEHWHAGRETGIDRYLRAFEAGAMPESICGERVKELGLRATALRARRQDLADEMEDADLTAPTKEELSVLRDRVAEAVAERSTAPIKVLLQALIHEIRVDSREASTRFFVSRSVRTSMRTMRFAHRPDRWRS